MSKDKPTNRAGVALFIGLLGAIVGGGLVLILYPPMTRADHDIDLFGAVTFFHGLFQAVSAIMGAAVGASLGVAGALIATKSSPPVEPPPESTPERHPSDWQI